MDSRTKYETTIQTSYKPPMSITSCVHPESTGFRQKLIEKNLYDMVNVEVCAQESLGPPPVDYTSVTNADFSKCIEGAGMMIQ